MKRANYDFPKKRPGHFFGKKVNDMKPPKPKKRPGVLFRKNPVGGFIQLLQIRGDQNRGS